MKTWVFTFGSGHMYEGGCVKITAPSMEAAREEMFRRYGSKWAFQYSEEDWDEWCSNASWHGVKVERTIQEIVLEEDVTC